MPAPLVSLARGALAGLAALGAVSCGGAKPGARAVVLVTLDTTRADHLGCYGYERAATPQLDALARAGALFESATAAAPVTLPAHAALMTGRFPLANGVRDNGLYVLPDAERTLAEAFHEHGFQTAAFVSAFPVASAFGLRQGFDVYDEAFHQPTDDPAESPDLNQRDAAATTDAALAWLGARKPGPFFLWVHYYDPHASYAPPSPWREEFANRPYDGEIAFMDHQLGRLIEGLGKAVPAEDTVLAAVGDHGEGLTEHGEYFHGVLIYESALHVPMILKAPGRIPAGHRIAEPVSAADVYPTLLSLAGIGEGAAGGSPIQGIDLAPLARGEATVARPDPARTPILAESLVSHLEYGWAELHAIRMGNWKYIEAPRPELYDLAADPAETTPAQDAQRAEGLRQALKAAQAAVTATGRSAEAPREMSAETLERLQSLGYMQGGGAGAPADAAAARKDPKDMIGLYQEVLDIGVAFGRGETESVVTRCRRVLEQEPGSPRVQWWLMQALLSLKRWDEADRLARPLLERKETTYDWVAGLLARAKEEQGDRPAAIALYRLADQREPHNARYGFRAARLLYDAGDFVAAGRMAHTLAERFPKHLPSIELAADCERRAGNMKAAVDLWMAALAIEPDEPVALAAAGPLLFAAGRYDEAQAAFERLSRVAPDRPEPARFLGALAVLRRDYPQAVTLLRQAETRAPDGSPENPMVRYWLGVALTRSGDLAGAEAQILPLVSRQPAGADGWRALGLLRRAQNRPAEAVEAFGKALERQPGDALSMRELRELGAAPPAAGT